MLISPDLLILKLFVFQHPFSYLLVFIILLSISIFYLNTIFALDFSPISRLVFVLIIIFALFHFILISCLLVIYHTIYLYNREKLLSKKSLRIIAITVLVIILFNVIWVIYIQIVNRVFDITNLSVIATIRKLYNFPKIFEKVIVPTYKLGLHYEIMLAFSGIILLSFKKNVSNGNMAICFILLLLLISISCTGFAYSFYNHIRYFYYLYPLILTLIAFGAITAWSRCKTNNLAKTFFLIGLSIFISFQLLISWRQVVNAKPGFKEKFSSSRIYLDFRTCGNFMNSNVSNQDYVISIASPHEAAVYFEGILHASLKTKLKQYEGQKYHYITGSEYFETKEDLISLVNKNKGTSGNVWVIIDERYKKNAIWVENLIEKLKGYIICEGTDHNTYLVKISHATFIDLLNLF